MRTGGGGGKCVDSLEGKASIGICNREGESNSCEKWQVWENCGGVRVRGLSGMERWCGNSCLGGKV